MLKLPNDFLLALRFCLREFRHGLYGFRLMLLNIFLGVVVISSVFVVSNTIRATLEGESKTLLGGDIAVEFRPTPASEEHITFIKNKGDVAYTISTRAMAATDARSQLVELKAVDSYYPLIGVLKMRYDAVWRDINSLAVDESFLLLTDTNIGDTVTIGNARYVISNIIAQEPDRIINAFSFGPRVMMSIDAFKASGLYTSRSFTKHLYTILFSNDLSLDEFSNTFKERFPHSKYQFRTKTDGNSSVQRFTDNLELLFALAGLSILLMGGVGIYSATSSYFYNASTRIALYKTLGLTHQRITYIFAIQLLFVALIATFAGIFAGLVLSYFSIYLLQLYIPSLSFSHFRYYDAITMSFICGVLTTYCFSYYPLQRYVLAKPNSVFRQSEFTHFTFPAYVHLCGALLLLFSVAIIILVFQDTRFSAGFVGISVASVAVFYLLTFVVRFFAERFRSKYVALHLGLKQLARNYNVLFVTLLALGGSTTLLIVLLLTEANLTRHIDTVIKEQAPSLFLFDIQPNQIDGLNQLLHSENSAQNFYMLPMVRGRIEAINGKEIDINTIDEDSRWAVRGDRGFSFSNAPPANADIVEGMWWGPNYEGEPLISLDSRLAKGFGVEVGDVLTLNVLGQPITATIHNLRNIDYSTLQINFAIMLSSGVLDAFPKSYVATLKTDSYENDIRLLKEVHTQFPNISVVQTKEVLKKVQDIVLLIARALKVITVLTLLASILVLASALQTSLLQQQYEFVVFKVLGSSRKIVSYIQLINAACAFTIVIVCATCFGSLASWLMSLRLRSVDFTFFGDVVLAVIMGIGLIYGLLNIYFYRKLFRTTCLQWLRNE